MIVSMCVPSSGSHYLKRGWEEEGSREGQEEGGSKALNIGDVCKIIDWTLGEVYNNYYNALLQKISLHSTIM